MPPLRPPRLKGKVCQFVPKEVIEPRAGVVDLAAVAAFDEISQKYVLNRLAGDIFILREGCRETGELGSVFPVQTHQLLRELLLQRRHLWAGRHVNPLVSMVALVPDDSIYCIREESLMTRITECAASRVFQL
jgi:hypothetical protein